MTAVGIAPVACKNIRVNATYVPILEGLIVIFGLVLDWIVGFVMIRMLNKFATHLHLY